MKRLLLSCAAAGTLVLSATLASAQGSPAALEAGLGRVELTHPAESGEDEAAAALADGDMLLGVFLEKNYSTQPGIQLGFTPAGSRLRYAASYSTTRLAGGNALVEDRVQLGASWYFRPTAALSLYAGLSGGIARFDREDDELFALLDNTGLIASLLLGLEGQVFSGFRLNGAVGLSALQSSTVYPFVASIALHHPLSLGSGR